MPSLAAMEEKGERFVHFLYQFLRSGVKVFRCGLTLCPSHGSNTLEKHQVLGRYKQGTFNTLLHELLRS